MKFRGKFVVTFAYRVQLLPLQFFFKSENLRCTCQQYGKTDGLRPHVAAAAEKEVLLETFILSYIETGGSINKVLNNTPENAGDKLKRKTWQKQHQ